MTVNEYVEKIILQKTW